VAGGVWGGEFDVGGLGSGLGLGLGLGPEGVVYLGVIVFDGLRYVDDP